MIFAYPVFWDGLIAGRFNSYMSNDSPGNKSRQLLPQEVTSGSGIPCINPSLVGVLVEHSPFPLTLVRALSYFHLHY